MQRPAGTAGMKMGGRSKRCTVPPLWQTAEDPVHFAAHLQPVEELVQTLLVSNRGHHTRTTPAPHR